MIAHKVVTEDRKSCTVTGKYELEYVKDSIVEAIPDTLGIFAFNTQELASGLVRGLKETGCSRKCKIIQVEILGEVSTPKSISVNVDPTVIDKFYSKKQDSIEEVFPFCSGSYYTGLPPLGTICCHSVRVLN